MKKLLIILVLFLFSITLVSAKDTHNIESTIDSIINHLAEEKRDYIENANDSINDWYAFSLARYPKTKDSIKKAAYLAKLKQAIKPNDRYINYYRNIIMIGSLNGDINSFDIVFIKQCTDAANKNLSVNFYIWALIALDTLKMQTNDDVRLSLIDKILEYRNEDEMFTADYKKTDIDLTAMAIVALAPYYNINSLIRTAIDNCFNYLYHSQTEDGFESDSVESNVWVMLASLAINKNPITMFKYDIVEHIMEFAVEDGKFSHLLTNKKYDSYATIQTLYGLIAYYRYLNGYRFIFDLRDEFTVEEKNLILEVNSFINNSNLTVVQEEKLQVIKSELNYLSVDDVIKASLQVYGGFDCKVTHLKLTDTDIKKINQIKDNINSSEYYYDAVGYKYLASLNEENTQYLLTIEEIEKQSKQYYDLVKELDSKASVLLSSSSINRLEIFKLKKEMNKLALYDQEQLAFYQQVNSIKPNYWLIGGIAAVGIIAIVLIILKLRRKV